MYGVPELKLEKIKFLEYLHDIKYHQIHVLLLLFVRCTLRTLFDDLDYNCLLAGRPRGSGAISPFQADISPSKAYEVKAR